MMKTRNDDYTINLGVKGIHVHLIGTSLEIDVKMSMYWNQVIWGPINVVLAAD